jgi:hypothetical protein
MSANAINGYLTFQGASFSGATPQGTPFTVLCGANPPQITDGFALWQTLSLPLRRGLTVFQGYDPLTMTVDLIFGIAAAGGWDQSDSAGEANEQNIQYLEWLAGATTHTGPPAIVKLFGYGPDGQQNALIPQPYQGLAWVISALEPGKTIKNASGALRIYYEVTVTLTNYLNVGPGPSIGPTAAGGAYVTATRGRDTPLKIAASSKVNSPTPDQSILAGRICSAPQNNPCRGASIRLGDKGIYFRIRPGVSVFVPGHTVN